MGAPGTPPREAPAVRIGRRAGWAFVQTGGEGGEVLRRVLWRDFRLEAWDRRGAAERAAEDAPADEAALMGRLTLVWLHNKARLARVWAACDALAKRDPSARLPLVSRLRAERLLDNKRELWRLCASRAPGVMPEVIDHASVAAEPGQLFIVKPEAGSCGRGIEVVRGGAAPPGATDHGLLVQRYVHRPLLLFGRYKFDVRCYVLIVRRADAGYEAYFHDGYLRRCVAPYGEGAELSAYAHLSNWNMSNKHAEYDEGSDCVAGMPVRLPATVFSRAKTAVMRGKMQRACAAVVSAYAAEVGHGDTAGQFGLFGVDFLFDESWGCHMLEWNSGPGVRWGVPFLASLHAAMLRGLLGVVLDPEAERARQAAAPASRRWLRLPLAGPQG